LASQDGKADSRETRSGKWVQPRRQKEKEALDSKKGTTKLRAPGAGDKPGSEMKNPEKPVDALGHDLLKRGVREGLEQGSWWGSQEIRRDLPDFKKEMRVNFPSRLGASKIRQLESLKQTMTHRTKRNNLT